MCQYFVTGSNYSR